MRVLSGIQPSGQLHLGNYFGSMRPNLELAKKADDSFFFVADLHALTTVQNGDELRVLRYEIVLDYLACGFDPNTTTIYYQSDVPAHTECMWILMTVTPMGLLERAVSFKDKIDKGAVASAGLFMYPVLMAADILLYNADHVPIGKDQKQHLEMTRDIAAKFNSTYGETFVMPEPIIREEIAVVPGINGQKMSKSYKNTIPIFGDEKTIQKAIMSIVSDSKAVDEPKDPTSSVIYQLHKLFLTEKEASAMAMEYQAGGMGYGDAKKMLFTAYMDHFAEMRAKREKLSKKKGYIEDVMIAGAKRAQAIAEETLESVHKAVGL